LALGCTPSRAQCLLTVFTQLLLICSFK